MREKLEYYKMLNTELCGVKLQNPTILASGILGTSVELLKKAVVMGAGAVTTKSIGPVERPGHDNPTVVEIENGLYNAVGLPTPGYLNMQDEYKQWKDINAPLIVSVYGSSVEDYVKIVKHIQRFKHSIVELNISCPNKDDGMVFGKDSELTKKLVKSVKRVSKMPVMPKLTPNCDNIEEIATACEKAGADAICAINTIQKDILHPELQVPLLAFGKGGISGPIIRKAALENVRRIAMNVSIPVVGVGGITYGEDAINMLKAGATAVGIGSGVYYRGIDIFSKICHEMQHIMEKRSIKSIAELKNA
ncbi:MAG: dihydroorotate dehydrogenase [Nanoarchaeota archaeon]